MCKESCWSQPQFVVATVTPLPTLSKYLTVGLWYNCMGGKVAAVSTPLWVRSGNLSSEAGTRLHSIKEYTLFPRTVVLYCKMGFLEGKVLNPKEGDPSGEIVVVWENRNGVAHPQIMYQCSSSPLWIKDQLPWQPNLQQLHSRQS